MRLLAILLVVFTWGGLRAEVADAQPGVLYVVRSTEVAWVVYEDKTRALMLARRGGPVTEYYGVPLDVFRQLMASDFMGGFVKANLERKYPVKFARRQGTPD
jgi:hypothetical protein